MKKLLIILGLIIISFSAISQGTIEALRDNGDSLEVAPYNAYSYGVYGTTQFVYRPYSTYLPLNLLSNRLVTVGDNVLTVSSTDGATSYSELLVQPGQSTLKGVSGTATSATDYSQVYADPTTAALKVEASNVTTQIAVQSSAITVTDDINSKGIVYAADYSTNYTARSLVDKAYIDNADGAKLDTANGVSSASQLWLLADTIVLAAFSAVDSFNTSFIYGSFYNNGSDTLVVTQMMACLQGTTPSLTVDIEWHATLGSGSATGLNSTPPTITSVTTGDSDTTFDNAQIPPGVFVWLKTPTVTTEPSFMTVTLLGYRLNRTY